ncbi:MAG: hypothetical protein methR_P1024 [Methyloprofundus sp.]|nr:MAG: hypothetical protein methR_P1024 [Methyloprofundus sp.]
MIETFYQKLDIPEPCFLGQKIFKKLFYENASFNSADKKAFTDDIDDIQWRYTLKPETINIPAFINQERDYSEVAIIQVNLKEIARYQRIAQIIQRTIPYPVLLIFYYKNQMLLSVADKLINQVDQEKIKVNDFYATDWIDLQAPDQQEQDFINSFTIKHFSYQDFYAFYNDITACIIALNCAKLGGRYTLKTEISLEQRIEYLEAIRQSQQKIQSLRTVLKKETQFNHKLNLNMQIKQLEQALAQDKQRVTANG